MGTGRPVWFKDPNDASFSLLLNISEEVGAWVDHGFLGFALDPNFRTNGYIYLLYAVDRHHLLNFGTPGYNPSANQYFAATIGRLTRYTCRASDNFRSVDPASRFILIGETKQTGFAICSIRMGSEAWYSVRMGLCWFHAAMEPSSRPWILAALSLPATPPKP